eukprot:jgi/Psemu1/42220/gm1.42220_g
MGIAQPSSNHGSNYSTLEEQGCSSSLNFDSVCCSSSRSSVSDFVIYRHNSNSNNPTPKKTPPPPSGSPTATGKRKKKRVRHILPLSAPVAPSIPAPAASLALVAPSATVAVVVAPLSLPVVPPVAAVEPVASEDNTTEEVVEEEDASDKDSEVPMEDLSRGLNIPVEELQLPVAATTIPTALATSKVSGAEPTCVDANTASITALYFSTTQYERSKNVFVRDLFESVAAHPQAAPLAEFIRSPMLVIEDSLFLYSSPRATFSTQACSFELLYAHALFECIQGTISQHGSFKEPQAACGSSVHTRIHLNKCMAHGKRQEALSKVANVSVCLSLIKGMGGYASIDITTRYIKPHQQAIDAAVPLAPAPPSPAPPIEESLAPAPFLDEYPCFLTNTPVVTSPKTWFSISSDFAAGALGLMTQQFEDRLQYEDYDCPRKPQYEDHSGQYKRPREHSRLQYEHYNRYKLLYEEPPPPGTQSYEPQYKYKELCPLSYKEPQYEERKLLALRHSYKLRYADQKPPPRLPSTQALKHVLLLKTAAVSLLVKIAIIAMKSRMVHGKFKLLLNCTVVMEEFKEEFLPRGLPGCSTFTTRSIMIWQNDECWAAMKKSQNSGNKEGFNQIDNEIKSITEDIKNDNHTSAMVSITKMINSAKQQQMVNMRQHANQITAYSPNQIYGSQIKTHDNQTSFLLQP